MNPEFQRNLWLEYSQRRVIFTTISLGLIFLLGNSMFGISGLRTLAEYAFYVIAVIWGARNAAQAVVGEIRDRTWDGQRLSSLSPFDMTWGKLAGATSYAWFGGALCLVVLSWTAFVEGGIGTAVADLFYFLMIGLMAQSVAFFASLLAARRRQTHSRLDVFFYQVAGLIAAWSVWSAWQVVSAGGYFDSTVSIDEMHWWGMSVDAPLFYLFSLMIFLIWAFIGCLRLMRLELSVQNTPAVWTAFVAFMAFYFAGHEGPEELPFLGLEIPSAVLPLSLACLTTAGLTYIAAFAEPKDLVLYRWLVKTFGAGQLHALWSRLQAWMVAYAATLLLGALLFFVLAANPPAILGYELFHASAVLSALGLLTRDLAIILYFPLLPGGKRSEFAAVITLVILYAIAPQLLGATGARVLFYPFGSDLGVVGPLIAWGEAAIMWLVLYRVAGKEILPAKSPDIPVNAHPERK